ncbi:MAG: 50S ribosomal protein L25 [Nitrospira sp.]|nr:50S ribosomal protein L25 [Candidatus Manganitrophaceae bacterium]HIL34958.1 50S ribosomal protein L25 [Candidatus Manganitrophaceae bacterium]
MQKINIQGERRTKAGKGPARQLRFAGKIPAVIYSEGKSALLTINPEEIDKVLHSASGENTLINLQITGEKTSGSDPGEHIAILRDFQRDPVTGKILHADFFEISMTEAISIMVHVEVIGETPIGVKADNGTLQHNMRELEVRCLPTLIPDHIQVDASALEVGQSIHVKDLPVKEGIAFLADPNLVVVSVTAAITDEKLESMLSAESGETKEPEVVEEKEEKEGAETEAKGEKKDK